MGAESGDNFLRNFGSVGDAKSYTVRRMMLRIWKGDIRSETILICMESFGTENAIPSLRVSLRERLQSGAKRALPTVLELPCQSVFLRQHQHPVIAAGHEPQRDLAQGEIGVVQRLRDIRRG